MQTPRKSAQRVFGRTSIILGILLVSAALVIVGPFSGIARAATSPSIAPDASSDATGLLSVGGVLTWTHTPTSSTLISFVTVVCAAKNTGITLSTKYGGAALSTAVTNQQSNMFVGMQYLSNPPLGNQTVAVTLTAAGGTAYVECSATTWTGGNVVDTSIASTNQDLTGAATGLSLNPKATIPSNEVFFSAINRYLPGAPAFSVGASAYIVDDNLNAGCQAQSNGWDNCIGSARLLPGGTSLIYSWSSSYPGYVVAAGFGIKAVVQGWAGWNGNQNEVIYMTTGLTSTTPYILPTVNATTDQTNNGIPNAIELQIGRAVNTTLQDLIPSYYYYPNNHVMEVYLTFSAASGTKEEGVINSNDAIQVSWQKETVTGFAGTQQNIISTYNSGINDTWGSTTDKGNINSSQLMAIYNMTWGGVSTFISLIGYVNYGYTVMKSLEQLVGVDSSLGVNLDSANGQSSYETFDIPMGLDCTQKPTLGYCSYANQQVFTPQWYTYATIADTAFTSPGSFVISTSNILGDWHPVTFGYTVTEQCSSCSPSPYGASATVSIPAVPAVTLTGHVQASTGQALAGTTVNIQAASGSESGTDFQVKTDSSGNYRFFAQVNTPYTVWASLSMPFGTQTATGSFNDGNPTSVQIPLTIPAAVIQGYVSCGYSGGCPSDPTDVVENKATEVQAQTTGWSFFFWIGAPGTYEVFASVGYYGSPTQPNVTVAMGQTYTVYLTLDYYPPPPSCLLAGTLISTPSGGQKRIEQFSEGDAVLGYNVTTGSWVKERVTSNTASTVDEILSINDGLLEATPTDQPLFVRNGTWVGWVLDPRNLTVGEQLFNPWTQAWINVTSLQVLQGSFKVYDLQSTAPNNFVANGVLVDKKIL